jgi:hypothetical protein
MLKLLRGALPRNPWSALALAAVVTLVALVMMTMTSEISVNGCVLIFMAVFVAFWAGQLEGL